MRQAHWTTNGIEVVEAEAEPLAASMARLQVTGCGICGSDLHIYRGMRSGERAPSDYATPGHEIAGTILQAPAGFDDVVYAVEPWVNCRECALCLRGDTILCDDADLMGISAAGGLADQVDVPPRLLHAVPDGVDGTLASLAEPWAVAVRAVHRAKLTELDERVLILGGGTIGLLCGVAARDRAARVGITCRYDHQAELARRFGLEPLSADTIGPWAAEHRPNAVIETVGGEADTMTEAVAHVQHGGRIVVVGVFNGTQPTDYLQVVRRELEIVGSFIYGTVGSGSEFGAAVSRMGSITSELAALQTHRFDLDDIGGAFTTADDKSNRTVKVTVGMTDT